MASAMRMNVNISSSLALLAIFLAISMSFNDLAYAKDYSTGSGTAAYYVPDNSSACKKGLGEAGDMVAMVPNSAFKNGRACGDKYQITCVGGTNNYPAPCKPGNPPVTVTVANSCSGEDCATFTLSTAAFEVIAKHDAGRVNISYKRIK